MLILCCILCVDLVRYTPGNNPKCVTSCNRSRHLSCTVPGSYGRLCVYNIIRAGQLVVYVFKHISDNFIELFKHSYTLLIALVIIITCTITVL